MNSSPRLKLVLPVQHPNVYPSPGPLTAKPYTVDSLTTSSESGPYSLKNVFSVQGSFHLSRLSVQCRWGWVCMISTIRPWCAVNVKKNNPFITPCTILSAFFTSPLHLYYQFVQCVSKLCCVVSFIRFFYFYFPSFVSSCFYRMHLQYQRLNITCQANKKNFFFLSIRYFISIIRTGGWGPLTFYSHTMEGHGIN